MCRFVFTCMLLVAMAGVSHAEETFIKIHKVSGSQILATKEATDEDGEGQSMRRRGRRGNTANQQMIPATIPATAKITAATRELRTFEFRVMGELPGGMRHKVFRNFKEPLSARIVTKDGRITELNVITADTDINQSNTDDNGNAVIAVRPKRPPQKKK